MKRIFVDRDVDISDSIFVNLGSLFRRKIIQPFTKSCQEEFSDIVVLDSLEDYFCFVEMFGTRAKYSTRRYDKISTRSGNEFIFIISLWTRGQKDYFFLELDKNLYLCQFNLIHLLIEDIISTCVVSVDALILEKRPKVYSKPLLSVEMRLEKFEPNFDDGL